MVIVKLFESIRYKKRLGPFRFRLLLSPRRSAIAVDFPVRLCPNRPSSSSTRFLCDPSGRNTNNPSRLSLSSFWRPLDFPCLWKVRNYCLHVDYAFGSSLVSRHNCMPILHDHRACPPQCTTSSCLSVCSLTHQRGFLRTISMDCRSKNVSGFSLLQIVV